MRIIGLMLLSALLSACVAPQPKKSSGTVQRHPLVGNAIVAANGTSYRFHATNDFPEQGAAPAGADCTCVRWAEAGDQDIFNGCARRDAKTSFVDVSAFPVREFSSIVEVKNAIREEWSIDDDHMRHDLTPKLTCDPASERREEELKNLAVTAFIFAMTKESDNDFHLILGDSACQDKSCFLNAEISGLTDASAASYQDLENARTAYLTVVGGNEPKAGSKYIVFDNPIPVRVEGSLFYDIDHVAGVVGPQGFRPDTSWEIHPVRSIAITSQ